MFFMNHQHKETEKKNSKSRMNVYEASFIVALCKYLIQQGYEASQVTILAMYKAQEMSINELLKDEPLLETIYATTVDNYQGEENEIILVSFVRSNDEKDIGFLKTANRINVAFSRAKKGLYCVGNFDAMAHKGRQTKEDHFPWNTLLEILRKEHSMGNSLEICCQNHGTKSMVSAKGDFIRKAPGGGCLSMCNIALLCGHICLRACHVYNMKADHAQMQRNCIRNCNRCCSAGHLCPLKCHYPKKCARCTVMVVKRRPQCNHAARIHCWQDPASIPCIEKVQAQSPCGHTVTIECSDAKSNRKLLQKCIESCNVEANCLPEHSCPKMCHYPTPCGQCTVQVEKLRAECQHTLRLLCWQDPSSIYCEEPCERKRSCGHDCKAACGAICDNAICNESVQVPSPCGHTVTLECCDASSDLKLLNKCSEPCNIELKCGHLCRGSCGQCKHGRLHIR